MIAPEEVAPAMLAVENSESFVTFDDPDELGNFFENHSLADWMLFLHPEQKKVADKDFGGPTRLRGVSGSGKTSVLVHRARFLARKYPATSPSCHAHGEHSETPRSPCGRSLRCRAQLSSDDDDEFSREACRPGA